MPALVLTSLVGLHVLLRWLGSNRRRALATVAVLSVFALASLWFNVGLAILYGHKVGVGIQPDRIGDFVDFQYRVHDAFPGGAPPHIQRGPVRPFHPRPNGTVFIVGNCEAVFWSSGSRWVPLRISPGDESVFCEAR